MLKQSLRALWVFMLINIVLQHAATGQPVRGYTSFQGIPVSLNPGRLEDSLNQFRQDSAAYIRQLLKIEKSRWLLRKPEAGRWLPRIKEYALAHRDTSLFYYHQIFLVHRIFQARQITGLEDVFSMNDAGVYFRNSGDSLAAFYAGMYGLLTLSHLSNTCRIQQDDSLYKRLVQTIPAPSPEDWKWLAQFVQNEYNDPLAAIDFTFAHLSWYAFSATGRGDWQTLHSRLTEVLGNPLFWKQYAFLKPEFSILFSECLVQLDSTDKAIEILLQQIQLPDFQKTVPAIRAYFNLADMHAKKEQYAKAVSFMQKSLKLNVQMEWFSPGLRSAGYQKISQWSSLAKNPEHAAYYRKLFLQASVDQLKQISGELVRMIATTEQLKRKEINSNRAQDQPQPNGTQNRLSTNMLILQIVIIMLLFIYVWVIHNKNKQLNNTFRDIKRLQEARNHLFNMVIHDIKSPVNAFLHFSENLAYLIKTNQKERMIELGKKLESDSAAIRLLIDNLTCWINSRSGTNQIKSDRCLVDVLVEDLIKPFVPVAEQKQVGIDFHRKGQAAEVRTDTQYLGIIIRNLIDNAIKHAMGSGNVQIVVDHQIGKIQVCISNQCVLSEERYREIADCLTGRKEGSLTHAGMGLGLIATYAKKLNIFVSTRYMDKCLAVFLVIPNNIPPE